MSRRIKIEKPDIGSRISVPRCFFDGDGHHDNYSSYISSSITKLYGTVVLYETKSHIKWDIDGQYNNLLFKDITIEASNTEKQVVDDIVMYPTSSGHGDHVSYSFSIHFYFNLIIIYISIFT